MHDGMQHRWLTIRRLRSITSTVVLCSCTDTAEATAPGVYSQITTGEEGFFKKGTPYTDYNPFGTPSNVKVCSIISDGQFVGCVL